jgi:hypothetical protein
MNAIKTGIFATTALTFVASGAQADDLLFVDLSVPNQITITATAGLSAATISGSDTTGFLLADFFSAAAVGSYGDTLVSGDLTSAANGSDGSPDLFTSSGNFGLNVWTYTNDATSDFTAGQVAFSGSGTWTLSATSYADALAGNTSGNIYFAADSDDDISGATLLGSWTTIPAPSSLALLGLGGVAAIRRRR